MNAPADVRGVIRAVIAELRADGNTGHVQNLLDADAAVANLLRSLDKYLDKSTLESRLDLIDARNRIESAA